MSKDGINEQELAKIYRRLQVVINGGYSPEDAAEELWDTADHSPAKRPVIDAALELYWRNAHAVDYLEEPHTIRKRDRKPWYAPPGDNGRFWPPLRDFYLEGKGWRPETVNSIDEQSTKIVSYLDNPHLKRFKTKGLVVGHVQAGKTANFTAVISKAADAGFRLFIVLSGLTNSLRQQTQERLDAEVCSLDRNAWIPWTTAEKDLGDLPMPLQSLLQVHSRNLVIVKKNAHRLRRLLKKIQETDETVFRSCPVLIIDDECDQASLNSSGNPDNPTTINGLLNDILELLPRVSYVGYTATPYANVLIDPTYRDLYPKDFIASLPAPPEYFGAERLFGRDLLHADETAPDESGLDMIRTVPEPEVEFLRPASRKDRETFVMDISPSLRRAILYFWLATAARVKRGQNDDHSTMLIHTTVYVQPHLNARGPIDVFRKEVLGLLKHRDGSLLSELRDIWEEEQVRVPPETFGHAPIPFEDLLDKLRKAVKKTRVMVENSWADERMSFKKPRRRYIVIGGNVLARGLTLEGLVVSFFTRTSRQYDSLMQMGRWFGYRRGYEDMPRVWMEPLFSQYFKDLATVEAEIRYDIQVYEKDGLTPEEFAVRVRSHPFLAITARGKMRSAVQRRASFRGRIVQTRKFHHRDRDWLAANWSAGTALVDRVAGRVSAIAVSRASRLFRSIPYTEIIAFLNDYTIHPEHGDMTNTLLKEYINRQAGLPGQAGYPWNVAVISSGDGPESEYPLGALGRVRTVNRSRLKNTPDDTADIKALMSLKDAVIDVSSGEDSDLRGWKSVAEVRADAFGQDHVPPLLLLYPIDRVSERQRGKDRVRLDAEHDVLGMGIVFPDSERDEPIYYSAPLPAQEEDPEYRPEMDL